MDSIASWYSNPAENNGPLMSVVTWCLVSIAGSFLAVRLCIRMYTGKLWLDDCTLVIAWILMLIQVTINQLSINKGYGKHTLDLDLRNFDILMLYGAAELTIYTVAIALSKISFGITLLRLTDGWIRIVVYFAISTLAIFAIPATVIPWVQCKPLAKTFVDFIPGECIDKRPSVVYGQFQAVWSALMDVCLALLPWKIIWGLQMRTTEKIGVCVAMSLGVFAGVTSIIRSTYIQKLTVQDVSFESYKAIIWAVAECAMTIVATSIPVLRVLLREALNSAITGYTSQSKSSKSRTIPSSAATLQDRMSTLQFGKKTPDISVSRESTNDVFGGGFQHYVELDDLVVDDRGRITSSTPDARPESSEHHVPNRLV